MQYFQKLIQKDLGFTHNIGEAVASHDRADIWSLHRGTSKDNAEPSLVFHFDVSKAQRNVDRNQSLAKSGLMRLKTLRHPDVLKFLTSVEGSDGTIYIATETATPLATLLSNNPSKFDNDTVQWGLFTVARALAFLHTSGLIHGRVNASTIFVTPNGDWKLGGLECVTPHNSSATLAQHATALQPASYQSPEFSNANWASVASAAPGAIDSWALGCLMYEAHAGSLTSPDQLQNISVFPKAILSAYQKLLASNPQARAPAGQLENHPYFKNSKFVELNLFVDNLALKGQLEREAFLGRLPSLMDRLPDSFCTHKVLPMLSQSMETGVGGSPAFSCIVKMKDRLSPEEFSTNIVQKYALNWFANNSMDRGLRVELYTNLSLFTGDLDNNAINNTMFPAMCAAFQDMQAPALRDASVKSILGVCDRLTDKNLNSVLMSHFARLQVDPEPAIRTNTTVCLGKIAPKLSQLAKSKVLAAAFIRSLKDPFPPARSAGVTAILATTSMYEIKDIACRLLPAVSPLLVDASGDVRGLAFKVLHDFEQRLSRNHDEMLRMESVAAAQQQQNGNKNTNVGVGNVSGGTGTGGSGSGWGLSTFTSMTAALLSKSDSASSGISAAKSTGISSDDFRPGGIATSVSSASANHTARPSAPSVMASGHAIIPKSTSSTWEESNGVAAATTAEDSFSNFGAGNGGGGNETSLLDDDDDDGWGDMDLKSESKEVDEEDLLASMLGQPGTKKPKVPAGLKNEKKTSNPPTTNNGGDLWDLAPPMVSRPKPKAKAVQRAGAMGGTRGGRPGTRRTGGGGAEDWESLLGGIGPSSSGTRRKPVGRG